MNISQSQSGFSHEGCVKHFYLIPQYLSENTPDTLGWNLIENLNLKIDAGSSGQNNTEER